MIRRSKTDAEGKGRSAYLSHETVRWLISWLKYAGINEGTLFRRLIGKNQIGEALNLGSIAPIFKRVAQWIGMPERYLKLVSGHSTRAGAPQDLAALDIDLAAITQAAGWSRPGCLCSTPKGFKRHGQRWRKRPPQLGEIQPRTILEEYLREGCGSLGWSSTTTR